MSEIKENKSNRITIKKMVIAALLTALTFVGTTIIRIPTPTLGYIHPGDGFVLLSGLLLGPLWGALAAGLGSALSDLVGGYVTYVPATFIIKALTALVAYYVFKALAKKISKGKDIPTLIISGVVGELVMVFGYFVFEIFLLAYTSAGELTGASLIPGVAAAAVGIGPNFIQAAFGVVIATLLYPFLKKLK